MLAGFKAAAQGGFYLEPRLGAGTFSMGTMKKWQKSVTSGSFSNAKATDRFPPYFSFGVGVAKDLDEGIRFGVFVEHGSTGGRVAYGDYSGEFTIDDQLRYNALGFSFYSHKPVKDESALEFLAGIEISGLWTKLVHKEHFRLYNESDKSEDEFNAIGLGLKPFVGLSYPLGNFPVSLSLGYLANASGPFHVPGKPDYKLSLDSSEENVIRPGWSGLRVNLSLAFML